MKITFKETKVKQPNLQFPCVYECIIDGSLVLFFNSNSGIQIKTSYGIVKIRLGQFYSGWMECTNINTWKPRPDISVVLEVEAQ